MVVCNLMNLSGIHPLEVYHWFMEMYVDSSDWVMAPNVMGMGCNYINNAVNLVGSTALGLPTFFSSIFNMLISL